jgi:hypothetical protein
MPSPHIGPVNAEQDLHVTVHGPPTKFRYASGSIAMLIIYGKLLDAALDIRYSQKAASNIQ